MPRTLLDLAADFFTPANAPETTPAVERIAGFAVGLEPVVADMPVVCPDTGELSMESWRATAVLNIDSLRRADPEEETLEARRGRTARLVEWMASVGVGVALQLQLRGDPARGALEMRLLVQVDGVSRDAARRLAESRLEELRRLVEDDPTTGFSFVAQPAELRVVRRESSWTRGRVARTQPWHRATPGLRPLVGPMVRMPVGAEGLDGVVRALLRQAGPSSVLVSMRSLGALDLQGERTIASAHSADVATRLRGRQIWDQERRGAGTHFPEDLADLEEHRDRIAVHLDWLRQLQHLAFDLSISVVGEDEPGFDLMHAVQGALVGAPRIEWRAMTEDQVGQAALGPREALQSAGLDLYAENDGVSEARLGWLTRAVPATVAARCLELPLPEADGLPGIALEPRRARRVPPVLVDCSGFLLGKGAAARGPVPVRLQPFDLDRHLYLCGRTGMGKSTVLRTLIGDLGRQGEGVGLLDPHGDLADDVLADLAGRRRVVVFDPTQPNCPGLDPMANDGSALSRERVVEELTATMFRLYPADYMGPMFDRHSRALLVPLLAAGEPLTAMARLATEERFRDRCLARLDKADPIHKEVLSFWAEEFKAWGATLRGEMHSYTVSKYDVLLKGSLLRQVCDPSRPQLDVEGILDRGDVLLARLPQGLLGPVSAYFLGMQLLSRLQAAVFGRVRQKAEERSRFTLVMDEFQGFIGSGGFNYSRGDRTLGPLLSEARKFGLRLVLANQFVAQLDDQTRQAVFGNVGSLACFRVGWADAEVLARELGGGVTPEELRDLPSFRAVARLSKDGTPAPVCSVQTIPPQGLEEWLRVDRRRSVRSGS